MQDEISISWTVISIKAHFSVWALGFRVSTKMRKERGYMVQVYRSSVCIPVCMYRRWKEKSAIGIEACNALAKSLAHLHKLQA